LHKVNYITLTEKNKRKTTITMSCLSQHKTKEELHAWLMNSAEDIRDDKSFVDMLAGDIWDMMNAEENKKLKEEIAHKNKKFGEWCEENKKLQEENKKLQEEVNDRVVIEDIADAFGSEEGEDFDWESEIHELQEENKKLKEWSLSPKMIEDTSAETIEEFERDIRDNWREIKELNEEEELEHYKESQIDYYIDAARKVVLKDGRILKTNDDWLDESDDDEEEELSKYEEEGSDWATSYGFTVKDGEYRLVMAGGGSHWEDYVIKRDGCFIHNGCGYSAVAQFISCPEAKYVKVVHIGATYELEEGETDMYDMITECYQEEIMEYCEEEEEEEEEEVVEEVVEEAKEMTRAERKQKWKEEHKK